MIVWLNFVLKVVLACTMLSTTLWVLHSVGTTVPSAVRSVGAGSVRWPMMAQYADSALLNDIYYRERIEVLEVQLRQTSALQEGTPHALSDFHALAVSLSYSSLCP